MINSVPIWLPHLYGLMKKLIYLLLVTADTPAALNPWCKNSGREWETACPLPARIAQQQKPLTAFFPALKLINKRFCRDMPKPLARRCRPHRKKLSCFSRIPPRLVTIETILTWLAFPDGHSTPASPYISIITSSSVSPA